MSSLIRSSRVAKIAALTAVGGSFYFFRDELKPYLRRDANQVRKKEPAAQQAPNESPSKGMIENMPEEVPYLLVGAGTASHSAMRAIRGHDPKAKIIMLGAENHAPYMRPALSKELWYSDKESRRNLNFRWLNGKERSIFFEMDEFFIPLENLEKRENGGVTIIKDMRLSRLDPENKIAHLENGQAIKYGKCLLAPGGKPKSLPELDSAPEEIKDRILFFKTADDFLKLEEVSETAPRILIIGGGFLGSELACALSDRAPSETIPKDQKIYQVFPESGNLGHVLPQYLSEHITKKVEQEGAQVIPNVEVRSVSLAENKSIEIKLSDGQTIFADYIVCAVGSEPDVELARVSGLEVDERTGGFLVNSELEARSNVWVAGDASCFYDIKLGRRRVEHHDHAVNSGKLVGQNMVGAGKAYTHQSMFWSDLGRDVSFEAVGIIDSSLPTVAVFAKSDDTPKLNTAPDQANQKATSDKKSVDDEAQIGGHEQPQESDKYKQGVVFYIRDGTIVGVLMWNLFNRLTLARRILNEQKQYDDYNEVAKLFNIHLDD